MVGSMKSILYYRQVIPLTDGQYQTRHLAADLQFILNKQFT